MLDDISAKRMAANLYGQVIGGWTILDYIDLPHNNLAQKIKTVPRDKIFSIISQIASAAKYLEELDLAHRDIKPVI
ncbi:MAG: hypothetical protein WAW09_05175 [Smithella sp.]